MVSRRERGGRGRERGREGGKEGREGGREGRIEGRRVDRRGCVLGEMSEFTRGDGMVRGVEGERWKRVE